jgi:hypothetical protein
MKNDKLNKISDINSYNGWFIQIYLNSAKDTIEEVLNELGLIY